jgi:hypothetical protein
MSADEYERAVHAWAVLIAAWLTDNPPADTHDSDDDQHGDEDTQQR